MIWLKRGALALFALLVVGALYLAMREQPALVDVATVREGPMQVAIVEEGRSEYRNTYDIAAPIAGHLARSHLEKGDRVTAGKTIVAAIHPLDPPLIDSRTMAELQAARQAAAAALSIARVDLIRNRTNLALAERTAERASRLALTGIIAESTLEKASGDVELQKAIVQASEDTIRLRQAELASAEARVAQPGATPATRVETCCINLTAPVDGEVLDMFVRSEQPVAVGTPIARIGDPSRLRVVVGLLSADAVRLTPGTPAEIVDWGGDDALKAVIERIEPVAYTKVSALGIEEQRVDAVLGLLAADPRLGHNFRVTARIVAWQSEAVLSVPISALFRIGNDWALFRLVDGRIAETKVTIGHMNDRDAEVLSGLQAGDIVVMHPGDTLTDGRLAVPR